MAVRRVGMEKRGGRRAMHLALRGPAVSRQVPVHEPEGGKRRDLQHAPAAVAVAVVARHLVGDARRGYGDAVPMRILLPPTKHHLPRVCGHCIGLSRGAKPTSRPGPCRWTNCGSIFLFSSRGHPTRSLRSQPLACGS